jgi:hypothetical protein
MKTSVLLHTAFRAISISVVNTAKQGEKLYCSLPNMPREVYRRCPQRMSTKDVQKECPQKIKLDPFCGPIALIKVSYVR